jgi:hypothetical protein
MPEPLKLKRTGPNRTLREKLSPIRVSSLQSNQVEIGAECY